MALLRLATAPPRRRRVLALVLLFCLGMGLAAAAQAPSALDPDPLTGPRSRLSDRKDWLGVMPLPAQTEILVLAGHADSQEMPGAGTAGEAVDLRGAAPMQPGIRDELYWNLLTAQAVVELGQQRGLRIRFYAPPERSIADGNDPRTNWSVGKAHAAAGGYALEIHYDAYGPDGVGSGLIPPLHRHTTRLDESLAQAFGSYPLLYREGLGAPRRGIAILEIGKLEGNLEAALRDPSRSEATINAIALRVVEALERGLGTAPGPVMSPTPPVAVGSDPQPAERISPPPRGGRSAPPARRR
ncbi:MAG: dehydrogenase [Cyanobium sp.]